jgi:hypothetical protein
MLKVAFANIYKTIFEINKAEFMLGPREENLIDLKLS